MPASQFSGNRISTKLNHKRERGSGQVLLRAGDQYLFPRLSQRMNAPLNPCPPDVECRFIRRVRIYL